MILSQSFKDRAALAGLCGLLLLSLFVQTRDGRMRAPAYSYHAPYALAAHTNSENKADEHTRYWAEEHHVIDHPSYTNFSVTD